MTLIPLVGQLEKLINEHGSAVILEKHVALLKEQIGLLEKRNEELERQNSQLTEKLGKAEQELARLKSPLEYVEWEGVLIKRLSNGGYADTPYCPSCKVPLSTTPARAGSRYICNRGECGYWRTEVGIVGGSHYGNVWSFV